MKTKNSSPDKNNKEKNYASTNSGDWPVIARFNRLELATIAAGMLAEENLEVLLEEDWAAGVYGSLNFGENVLRIRPNAEKRARKILEKSQFKKNLT